MASGVFQLLGYSYCRLMLELEENRQYGRSRDVGLVGSHDVTGLYEEYKQSGAKIVLPPTNYPHALEMHVEDPDGHVLRFVSVRGPSRISHTRRCRPSQDETSRVLRLSRAARSG